jgi:hypothetical protein
LDPVLATTDPGGRHLSLVSKIEMVFPLDADALEYHPPEPPTLAPAALGMGTAASITIFEELVLLAVILKLIIMVHAATPSETGSSFIFLRFSFSVSSNSFALKYPLTTEVIADSTDISVGFGII